MNYNTYTAKYENNKTYTFRLDGDIEAAYLHCKLTWGLKDFVELYERGLENESNSICITE